MSAESLVILVACIDMVAIGVMILAGSFYAAACRKDLKKPPVPIRY